MFDLYLNIRFTIVSFIQSICPNIWDDTNLGGQVDVPWCLDNGKQCPNNLQGHGNFLGWSQEQVVP